MADETARARRRAVAACNEHAKAVRSLEVARARELTRAVSDGVQVKELADALGVPRSTVYRWMGPAHGAD